MDHSKFYCFVILNDGGDDWVTSRTHILGVGSTAEEAENEVWDEILYGRERPDVALEDYLRARGCEYRLAEEDSPDDAICSAPSAGDPEYWEDDQVMGLADFLSMKKWTNLLGIRNEYMLPRGLVLSDDTLEYISESEITRY